MKKTFVFKLYHSKKNKALHRQIDVAASIYNYCIAAHRCYFKIFRKHLNKNKLQKHITKLKKRSQYAHWNGVPSQAIQDITDRIERAYQLFFKSPKKGKVRPPSFKKRERYKSITLKQAGYSLLEGNQVKLGKKIFKYFKSRDVEGTVKTVTIKRDPLGDTYLCFACEIPDVTPIRTMTGEKAGFDFGLKDFLTTSEGVKMEAPLFFKKGIRGIRRAGKAVSNKKRGSSNRRKARLVLIRSHKKIVNQRKDYHIKLARELSQKYDYLFFEDLNLKGMQQLWGRKISDLGFSNFMRDLKHQCDKSGARMHVIDRFYPSSKTCHACNHVLDELSLSVREWQCPRCATTHDRDINAAINIKFVGASTIGLGDVRPNSFGFLRLNPESNVL